MDSGQSHSCGILAIFYAVATVLVIMLAISLLWKPFFQLMTELNMIITSVLRYIHKEIFPDVSFFEDVAGFFASNEAIICIAFVCFLYLAYQTFADILLFYRYHFNNLHECRWTKAIKKSS